MTAAHADLELHRGENHERRMAMRRLRRNGAQLRSSSSSAARPRGKPLSKLASIDVRCSIRSGS
jgi:hypothetical protein